MYSFNIIITELCNANCSHCYMITNKSKKTLSKENIDIIINNIPNNTKSIVLTGGEVFLVKDILIYFIKSIKNKFKDINIGLESNGIYIYNNDIKKELEYLKTIGVNYIRLSDDIFHEIGGVDLNKVRNIKNYETKNTPKIKYLIQDNAIALGNATQLDDKFISKPNCMNNINSVENPYLFIDVNGNIYPCAWKCTPIIGNIFNDKWNTIEKNLYTKIHELILKGNIEEAISKELNKEILSLKDESKREGQCSLCIKYLKKIP